MPFMKSTKTISISGKTLNIEEVQRLIPELENDIIKKDRIIHEYKCVHDTYRQRIKELEEQVLFFQAECDKLRSVLEQTTVSATSPHKGSSQKSSTEMLVDDLQNKTALSTIKQTDSTTRAKKVAVSAEPTLFNKEQNNTVLQHHPKSVSDKRLIREAVQKNDFLRQLEKEQVIEIVESMYEWKVPPGEWVIREGEPGERVFVVANGMLRVTKEGKILRDIGAGNVIGELAILYNCTRTASIQAITEVQLWVLDRSTFQMITMKLGIERHSQMINFLKKVSLFSNLNEDRLSKLADVMDQDYYPGGHYILREGEKGNTFFVINSGSVRITQQIDDEPEPREIRIMGPGDFFGEKALLGEQIRTANVIAMNPGVEVLTLDRISFLNLIGELEALKRDYGDNERRRTHKEKRHPSNEMLNRERCAVMNELKDLQLKHLKRIATLGVGGFGRVELVCINNDKSRTFALKAMKKKHIVDTKQQEHIFSERNILFDLNSDWIVNLYKTFRDSKYVYMLLEACLGGELWTTLRDHGHFDEFTARFYIACVLEALDYIHSKNIIYRDLKPENCLITASGYIKLVDFGFAKRLSSGKKTWTFCGTPEYVSPEIILNKGHDRSADLWSVGIFTCELLLGRPPFQASDPMKTYTLILKGVDALDIPNKRMGKAATTFVKKLCKDNPAERLGIGVGGINEIRKNRWFMGFDWEGLRSRTAKPPILPRIENPADHRNFDSYEVDNDIPPDEFSGWDEGF
uniref:cGMP-dependent protein kinase n=1 Tax=Strongyloides venezuelensis TaxID=75913 RepID=A0A0K0FYZ6_STRVS